MQRIEQLTPDIWAVNVSLGDYAVRGLLLQGDERCVVWDSLTHPQDMQLFLPMIGERELTIVYSHADWDHIWGTAGLPYHKATIIGHNACKERFLQDVPSTLAGKLGIDPTHWGPVKLIPPTVTFQKEYAVRLGATTLFLSHLPGHTPDSIAGFLPDSGILLLGDAVEIPFPMVPAEAALASWIEELRKWLEDSRVRTVIPSHGPIGGCEIIAENLHYLRLLLAGQKNAVPENLNDFYRETHQENERAWVNKT